MTLLLIEANYSSSYLSHVQSILIIMGGCLEIIKGWFKVGRRFNINGKRLKELHQIAEGGFGYVLLVEDVDSKRHYALKKLICQNEESKHSYKNEVEIMKKLSACQHVIGYHGSYEIERNDYLQGYILMELADKTVYDLIADYDKKKKTLTEAEILRIFKQTVMGLKEMHELGVFHQDVKVENILLTKDGKAKLCDLGSCSTQRINLEQVSKAKMYHYEQRFEKNTTLMYRPPEMIDLYLKYPIDDRVDIWMLGCVLFVLNYHYHPFQQEGKLSIVNANIRYAKGKHSQKMQDLMRHLLTPNPYFRPKIDQVLNIVEHWEKLQKIPLNKVASTIKSDQQLIHRGEYERASNGDWRNMR